MDEFEPIREALRDEPSEARVQRMWRGIEARRARTPGHVGRRAFALVAASAAIAAFFAWGLRGGTTSVAGPLRLASGEAMPAGFGSPTRREVVTFSDASHVELAPGTRLEVVDASASTVGFALRRGSIRVSVTPHGPRRWRVDCGTLSVEVVGTVFRVDRDADDVRVSVERGAVAVRGVGVTDGVQRLGAGDRLHVPSPTSARADEAAAPRASSTPPDTTPGATARGEGAQANPTEVAARAPGSEATAEAMARDDAAIDARFAEADAMRARGEAEAARLAYGRIVASHPRDRRASLAAYAMGQLELDSLGRPEEAARSYARSLALGLPRGMRETAEARRIEALRRAGSAAFPEAAREYLARYPDGRHRASVERWLAP